MSDTDKQRVIALRALANSPNTSAAAKAQLLDRAKQIESGGHNTTGAHMKTNTKKTSPKKATSKQAQKASPKKATAKKPAAPKRATSKKVDQAIAVGFAAARAGKAKETIKKAEQAARKETEKAAEKLQVAKVELAKAAALPKGSAAKKSAIKKAAVAKKSAVKSAKKAEKAMANVTETVAAVPTAPAAKKSAAKKSAAKKSAAKASPKKSAAKKSAAKKSAAKKSAAKKSAAKAKSASASPAKKSPAKKSGKKKVVHSRHTTTAIELHGRKTPESVKKSIAGAKKTRSVQTYEKGNRTIRVDHRLANPLTNAEGGFDAKKMGIVVFGATTGFLTADVVDRAVATAARGDAKYPWYSRDAAVRIMQRPDAMRVAAQGAVALAFVAGSMATKEKMPELAMFFASGAVGTVVHGLGQVAVGWIMPKILSVKLGNERSIPNRLYPMEQEAMQAPAAAEIAAENKSAKDAPGQQDGATAGSLPDSYLFAPAPATAALPSGTTTSTTASTTPSDQKGPRGIAGTPTVHRPVQGTPRAGAFVGEPVAGPRVTPGTVGAPKIRPVDGPVNAWEFGMRPPKGAGMDMGACEGGCGGGCGGKCGGKCESCDDAKGQDGLNVRVPNPPAPPVRVSNLPPPRVIRDGGTPVVEVPVQAAPPVRATPSFPEAPSSDSATMMRPGAAVTPTGEVLSLSTAGRALARAVGSNAGAAFSRGPSNPNGRPRGTISRRGFDGLSSGSDTGKSNFRTQLGRS